MARFPAALGSFGLPNQGVTGSHVPSKSLRITRNGMHVHDLHATILHLLGIDHEQLTYRFQGRDFRLTDVHGNVVHDIFA